MGRQLAVKHDGLVLSQGSSLMVSNTRALDLEDYSVCFYGLPLLFALPWAYAWYYRRVMSRHIADRLDLGFGRGCALGLPISILLWAVIITVIVKLVK